MTESKERSGQTKPRAPRQRKPKTARRVTDDELREDLLALCVAHTGSGPNILGLGQLQMWARGLMGGVLPVDERADPPPRGVIAA